MNIWKCWIISSFQKHQQIEVTDFQLVHIPSFAYDQLSGFKLHMWTRILWCSSKHPSCHLQGEHIWGLLKIGGGVYVYVCVCVSVHGVSEAMAWLVRGGGTAWQALKGGARDVSELNRGNWKCFQEGIRSSAWWQGIYVWCPKDTLSCCSQQVGEGRKCKARCCLECVTPSGLSCKGVLNILRASLMTCTQ